jgi:hypothetical protein
MKQYLMSVSRPKIPQNFRLAQFTIAMKSRATDFQRMGQRSWNSTDTW